MGTGDAAKGGDGVGQVVDTGYRSCGEPLVHNDYRAAVMAAKLIHHCAKCFVAGDELVAPPSRNLVDRRVASFGRSRPAYLDRLTCS